MKFRNSVLLVSTIFVISGCGGKKEGGTENAAAPAAVQNPVDPATAGNVTGSVKFTGTKPAAKKIVMSADAICKTLHASSVDSEEVVVNPNGTLRYVYIYVKSGLGDLKFPPATTPVVFDQKGCMYIPHVAAVQVGQELIVRNSDGVLHNVHASPKLNVGFNFGQPMPNMESKKSFSKPEVMIPVKCDVHPWMHGFIGVQDHPYAVVTGEDGSFALNNLPPGTYEIEAWHEKYGTSVQKVTVGPKESKAITFTFKGA